MSISTLQSHISWFYTDKFSIALSDHQRSAILLAGVSFLLFIPVHGFVGFSVFSRRRSLIFHSFYASSVALFMSFVFGIASLALVFQNATRLDVRACTLRYLEALVKSNPTLNGNELLSKVDQAKCEAIPDAARAAGAAFMVFYWLIQGGTLYFFQSRLERY
jgi:hypothetical protein